MILGIGLHGWEVVMVISLVTVGVSTGFVVTLQRAAAKQAHAEFEKYRLDADVKIADAGKAAEDARAQVAIANQKAASLEAEAAKARLETQRLKEQLAWRELSPTQRAALIGALRGRDLQVTLSWFTGDPEAAEYAAQIAEALRAAGLRVEEQQAMAVAAVPVGVLVFGNNEKPDAALLLDALRAAGVDAKVGQLAPQAGLWIGTKPRKK